MKRFRILVLMHEDLVPPDSLTGQDVTSAEWKTEYDVVSTLRKLGHDVTPLGVKIALDPQRRDVMPELAERGDHIIFRLPLGAGHVLPREGVRRDQIFVHQDKNAEPLHTATLCRPLRK